MLFLQACLDYAMRNACEKNAILFMDLHVSRLDTLRIHVTGTVVPTATCSVFLAGDVHGDCATITFIWRNYQVSRVTLLIVV
ncbi:hypothetical protein YA52_00405 [Enterobacter roggenkampii]|nr:hypothetical protein YA52_00405 [Enterobacter roggenkampii]